MKRQETTNPDTADWTLTPQQEAAVDLLAAGRTVTDAAEAIGVVRQTVSGWLNQHPGFRAALNARRRDLWAEHSDRLRGLLPKALDVLAVGLEGGSLQAAVAVLKAAGLHGLNAPAGPTTAEDVEIEERLREGDRRMKALAAVW